MRKRREKMVDVIAIVLASTSRNNPLKYSIWNQIRPHFTVVVVVVLLWSFYFSFLFFFFDVISGNVRRVIDWIAV